MRAVAAMDEVRVTVDEAGRNECARAVMARLAAISPSLRQLFHGAHPGQPLAIHDHCGIVNQPIRLGTGLHGRCAAVGPQLHGHGAISIQSASSPMSSISRSERSMRQANVFGGTSHCRAAHRTVVSPKCEYTATNVPALHVAACDPLSRCTWPLAPCSIRLKSWVAPASSWHV